MSKTTIEETVEAFKKLRTCDLQEAEAILEDGTKISDFLRTALTTQKEELVKEWKDRFLSLAASATLCDHMGDMWDDINKVLEDIGEKELADADHEYYEEEEEDGGEGGSEFTRILAKRGIKTVWDTPLCN